MGAGLKIMYEKGAAETGKQLALYIITRAKRDGPSIMKDWRATKSTLVLICVTLDRWKSREARNLGNMFRGQTKALDGNLSIDRWACGKRAHGSRDGTKKYESNIDQGI
jgi:hypothetical protein